MAKRIKAIDIDSLETAISDDPNIIRDILMNDVAPVVEDILAKHIEHDIYGAYTPVGYERRYSLTKSIVSKMINGNTLLVTSIAQPNLPHTGWVSSGDGAFLAMLENGDLGWWRKGFPRPAVSNAQKEVDSSSAVRSAIQRS